MDKITAECSYKPNRIQGCGAPKAAPYSKGAANTLRPGFKDPSLEKKVHQENKKKFPVGSPFSNSCLINFTYRYFKSPHATLNTIYMPIEWWIADFMFALWLLFPIYAATMFPPIFGGGKPLDCRKFWLDHRRVLGDGKTVKGTAIALLAGLAIGFIEIFVYPELSEYFAALGASLPQMTIETAFALTSGAIVGDLCASFIKRRLRMERGADAPLLDQLNAVVGGFAFAYFFTSITLGMIVIAIVLTVILHRAANIVGYKFGYKKVPW